MRPAGTVVVADDAELSRELLSTILRLDGYSGGG
jgi:hypothetical protein